MSTVEYVGERDKKHSQLVPMEEGGGFSLDSSLHVLVFSGHGIMTLVGS